MILFIKRITKALIRLRGCAGWSAPVLFANPRRQVFSRRGPYLLQEIDTLLAVTIRFGVYNRGCQFDVFNGLIIAVMAKITICINKFFGLIENNKNIFCELKKPSHHERSLEH